MTSRVTTPERWLERRLGLLEREKELTSLRDQVAAARRSLPWVAIDKPYLFDTEEGKRTLAELFAGRSQLIVYHFMMGPDWEEGCPICSFWADTYEGLAPHLAARDAMFLCCSRAPLEKILHYKRRMGWTFPWVSSAPSDFNRDFGVSFTPEQRQSGAVYNYKEEHDVPEEAPGLSVFAFEDGSVYHTYSTYSRGLDPLNGAYQLLDLTPRGRDEEHLPWPMAWVRRHDSYTVDGGEHPESHDHPQHEH
jgi:predicted dithiol-disulfide oxidoreductase (DUF899 family)